MELEDSLIDFLHYVPDVPLERLFGKSKKSETTMSETSYEIEVLPQEGESFNTTDFRLLEIKLKLAESTGNIDAVRDTVDFPDFDDLFSGKLPRTLLYFDRKSCSLKQIRTFDEMSKYLERTDKRQAVDTRVLGKLVSAPATHLVHFMTLGNYLRNLYETDKLMDVYIDVDGIIFMAHRVALCCSSEYFSNLFTPEKYQKIPVRVKITGISAAAFSAFLEFVYTGEITIHHGIVVDILLISKYLRVKALKNRLDTLSCNFTLQEAVKLLSMGTDNQPDELFAAAFANVLDQFMPASVVSSFLEIDVETLCSLLKSDTLRVSNEFQVFQVAVRWIVHGTRARLQHVTRVMKNVRFCHMSQKELFKCLVETKMFMDCTDIRDLILIANWIITAIHLRIEEPFHFEIPPPRMYYIKNTSIETLHSPNRIGKPRQAVSPGYHTLPETQQTASRIKSASPRYGKPVIRQQDLGKSSISQASRKSDVLLRKKNQKSESKVQKRAISPAGHAKPTIWSWNKNQSSNTSPDKKDIPPRSSSSRMQYQETTRRQTEPVILLRNAMTAQEPLQSSSTMPTALHSVQTLNYVTPDTIKTPNIEREIELQTEKSRQIGQRYEISPGPPRSAKPVVLQTVVRTVTDVQGVPDVRLDVVTPQHHVPLADIIVVGPFEKDWISEDDDNCQSESNRRPIQFCNLPVPRRYFAVAKVARNAYVIGGYIPEHAESSQGVTNMVVKMDCNNKSWTAVEPMLEPRMCHCACAIENDIYVFGGLDKNERPLGSCEIYSTCTDQWSSIAPLPMPFYAGSAVGLGGKCYIAGGLTRSGMDDSLKVLMTLICFDPRSRRWSFMGHTRMPICHASLVHVQGRLYLCGGATQRKAGRRLELVSVAFIDEYNFINNMWHFRTEMNTPRHEACVAVVGSRLYVIGGKNSAEENVVRSVECYDTRDSVWLKFQLEMPFPARWIDCVTYQHNDEK